MLRQALLERPCLLRHEALGLRRQPVIERVDDRLLVDREIKRLAHRAVGEWTEIQIRRNMLHRGRRGHENLAPAQRLRLLHEVRQNALQAGVIDLAGAELGVQDGQVRDVFEDDALQIRSLAVVAGMGVQQNMVARHALAPAERSRPDRRVVKWRAVRVRDFLQDVFGHHAGQRQDRHVGRIGRVHSPMNLVGRDDLDVLDQVMADAVACAEIGVVDQLEGELHVLCRERCAIMPLRVAAQLDLPDQPVGRQPAVLDGRNFASQVRNKVAIRIDKPQRREDLPPNALIDLDTGHQGMKDGRLLRQGRDHLSAWLGGRIGRTFRLSKCGSWNSQSRRSAGPEQHELAAARHARGQVA